MKAVHDEASGRPDEGLLVRHLHEELDATASAAVAAHLEDCADCRRALAELRARERRIRDALRVVDAPAYDLEDWAPVLAMLRERSARRANAPRWLLVAGVVIALIAVGIATPPVRAWIAGGWAWVRGPDPQAMTTPRAPTHAAVRFEAPGPTLDIVLTTRPAGGTLGLRWTDDVMAAVSVTDGGSERFEIGAGLVRIHDEPSARASYEVTLPLGVDRVRVRVGDAALDEYSRREHGARRIVVELARR